MKGYKIFTHDWRSPLQGGSPHFIETPPFPTTLPTVRVDDSEAECAAGWNFSLSLAEAVAVAGWWPTGRPAQVVTVEADAAVMRGHKCRAATLTLLGLATSDTIQSAMLSLVQPFAGKDAQVLAEEQWRWYSALGRPELDPHRVEEELQRALMTRGLPQWSLRACTTARDAKAAWDAWAATDACTAWSARAAWAARAAKAAWDACTAWTARGAWDAKPTEATWAAWSAWTARAVWDAWAATDVCNARAATDACNALIVQTAVRCFGLQSVTADYMTVGLRDAYHAGLDFATPTGPQQLGWSMMEGLSK